MKYVLILGDSRRHKVKPLVSSDEYVVNLSAQSGATLVGLLDTVMDATSHLHVDLVIILGGINDITKFDRSPSGRKTGLSAQIEATVPGQSGKFPLDRAIKKGMRRLRNCRPNTRVLLGSLPHANVIQYSARKIGPRHTTTCYQLSKQAQ